MSRRYSLCLVALLTGLPALAHDWNGIVRDRAGNLFVVDAEWGEIWKISPAGKVESFIDKKKGDGLCHPHHLAIDAADNLWLGSG